MTTSERVDVCVVGAGLSGLYAARKLAAANLRVCVLEARDRVGGRTLSHTLGGGRVDLGAQWIGPTQDRVRALASELGVDTYPQYDRGQRCWSSPAGVKRFRSVNAPVPPLAKLQLAQRVAELTAMSLRVDTANPGSSPDAARHDQRSVADWLGTIRNPDARALLDAATQMVLGDDTRRVSLLYWLHYLRSGGGILRLTDTRGGAQQDRFVQGAQELSLRLATQLSDRVRLQHAVESIEQSNESATVRHARGAVTAGAVVLALAPSLIANIEFTPALPARRAELCRSMPMGAVAKCIVSYETPFWRRQGLSGEAIATQSDVRGCFDDTSHDGRHAALVCFVVGDAARDFADQPLETRRRIVLAQVQRWFGPQAANATDYIDHNWVNEEYSGGCYVGLFGPGDVTRYAGELRVPCDRIYFAGTETATRWVGYLDGAIEAGSRAADEVLARFGG